MASDCNVPGCSHASAVDCSMSIDEQIIRDLRTQLATLEAERDRLRQSAVVFRTLLAAAVHGLGGHATFSEEVLRGAPMLTLKHQDGRTDVKTHAFAVTQEGSSTDGGS